LVGAARDDDGGTDRGAIYLLSLSTSGTVESQLKISNTSGGLGAGLDNGDYFGTWVSSLGDLDGDDLPDLVVGAPFDDDGGSDHGAAYVIGLSEPAAVSVNSTADLADLVPGDGICDTGATNSEGADECTLRAAIEETNATASIDIIDFALPLSDPGYVAGPPSYWVIAPASNLPAITDIVTIDGYTQAGSSANTVAAPGGLDTVLKVRLDGTSAVQGIGFNPGADGSVVRGLNIANFASRGISMAPGVTNVEISGNFIGTNIDGTAANSNTIGVFTNGAGLRVGSGVAADRNLISGNSDLPVRFSGVGAQGGIVQGNLLGTDVTGMSILAASNWGVMTDNGAGSLTLGVDGDGFDDAGEANIVIAGSNGSSLTGSASVIAGNHFGVGSDGATALGAVGLGIGGSGTRVGSNWDGTSDSLEANLFSGLVGAGISIAGAADDVSVLGNRFWGNGGLGIDLGGGGVTENDPNDVDTGPNGLLNFPEMTSAVSSYGSTQIDFDLDVPAGDYRVEAFVNPSGADPTGNGEGEQFVGATVVSHTGSGTESFQVTISGAPGDIISLTATEQMPGPVFGSTSEFSDVAAAVCADADSDGLCDDNEDANADADNDPATNPGPDTDGDTIPNYLDPDDDNDGSPTSTENADPNGDGDPRDALDSDFDGQPDWLDVEAGPSTTPLGAEQKISDLAGGLGAALAVDDNFGRSLASVGDIDGDGVGDLVVGKARDDDGGNDRGAVYVLFLNADGTVKSEQKISDLVGGLMAPLKDVGYFGWSAVWTVTAR
ncbi:MAG: hypothetical protein R2710_00080, partial [Acidimicrobiales bacterium]